MFGIFRSKPKEDDTDGQELAAVVEEAKREIHKLTPHVDASATDICYVLDLVDLADRVIEGTDADIKERAFRKYPDMIRTECQERLGITLGKSESEEVE